MSEIKVNSIKGVGASVAALSINNSDGTCTANITNKSNRNLIINGACLIAQRSVSSTTNGYGSLDRFRVKNAGVDEAPTHAQVDVGSSDLPFTKGLTKALKVTNGNQTSGAGVADFIQVQQRIESQDIRNSGWNYTSTSSNITLSFYARASVSQTYFGLIRNHDTNYNYPFSYSLTANTWTKVTKTIPGNSNLNFNNDTGQGIDLRFTLFYGTDYTSNASTVDNWVQVVGGANETPDQTSTWYTTNDATWEITGVQLEVGSVATDFEHRSFAQELQLCKRYFQFAGGAHWGATENTTNYRVQVQLEPEMRAAPTVTVKSGGVFNTRYSGTDVSVTNPTKGATTIKSRYLWTTVNVSGAGLTNHRPLAGRSNNANADYLSCDAEL